MELLLIPECPGGDEASRLLRTALDDIGRAETPFTVGIIDTVAKAQARYFAGSPSFIVDGTDLFAMHNTAGALACRIYATPNGPRNVPGLLDLRRALNERAGT